MNDTSSVFQQHAAQDVPRDQWGRYKLPDETGEEVGWTRATTFAATLAEQFGLSIYHQRQVAFGMGRRPDLVTLASTVAGPEDKKALGAIVDSAHEAAGTQAKANRGTAVHAAIQRIEQAPEWTSAINATPEELRADVLGYFRAVEKAGLQIIPHLVERVVIIPEYRVAGTPDNYVLCPDGKIRVLDKKTGNLDYAAIEFAVQLALYANAKALRNYATNTYEPLPEIATDYAIIAHVVPGTGVTELKRVNIAWGWAWTRTCAEVMDIRKTKNVITPYISAGRPLVDHASAQAMDENNRAQAFGHTAPPVPSLAERAEVAAQAAYSNTLSNSAPSHTETVGHALPDRQAVREAYRHLDPATVGNVRLETLARDARTPMEASLAQEEIQRRAADFECRFDGKRVSEHPINIPGQFHCITPEPRPSGPTCPVRMTSTGQLCGRPLDSDGTCPDPGHKTFGAVADIAPDTDTSALFYSMPEEDEDPSPAGAAAPATAPAAPAPGASPAAPPAAAVSAPTTPDAGAAGAEPPLVIDDQEAAAQALVEGAKGKAKLQQAAKDFASLIAERTGTAVEFKLNQHQIKLARAMVESAVQYGVPLPAFAPSSRSKTSAPQSEEDRKLTTQLEQIQRMPTVEGLVQYQAQLGERWSDEHQQAARVRAEQINAAAEQEREGLTVEQIIQGATSRQTLQIAWRKATNNGADESGWTPELNAMAEEKSKTLTR